VAVTKNMTSVAEPRNLFTTLAPTLILGQQMAGANDTADYDDGTRWEKMFADNILTCVVDPDPQGSETYCRIRILNVDF
jgi:hypothetical protein